MFRDGISTEESKDSSFMNVVAWIDSDEYRGVSCIE